MFKKLFGGPQKAPGAPGTSQAANQTINAMQSLAEREEQLEKKKLLLEKRMNDEMEKAREFTRQKKKSQALMCLKKKKMFEQQLERMDALISRVMEQRSMLEEQQTTIGVLSSMQDAAKAQKKTMQEMKIENIDSTLEEIQEVGEQMRVINEAISQPVGGFADMEMDDLEAELAELEAEELDTQLLEPAPVPAAKAPGQALPSVPAGKVAAAPQKTPEELELEALQAEMAL
ncbi:component of the ESCRT-III complex [Scenedesmus sp. NREL 46B-D3]|nr:component of the ESCRT-III complex [Scenedesmus sp. NREL 46B-D3]